MKINHDYSYLGNGKELIKKGYADLDIHSINFDRYFSDEEKENNRKLAEKSTTEEWNKHCDESSKKIYNQMLPIIELLNNKYDIHQITEEKSSNEHYKSNWDLFFWSNRGWNNKEHFDHVKLNFNSKRMPEQNMKLLNEIISLLEELEVKNVYCRVQYDAKEHKEEMKQKATEICQKLLEKPITYNGMEGKIKIVDQYEDEKIYGFVKKRVRKSYYKISESYLVLNFA